MTAPPYKPLVKPAILTAGAALLLFGVAHAAFITWEVDRSQDASLVVRLGQMLVAPIAVGVPFALVAALLGAAAWRGTSVALGSWRFGAVLASSLVGPVAVALAFGPLGDELPGTASVMALALAVVALPSSIAYAATRRRESLAMGPMALVLVAPWSLFLLGEGLTGWVVPFVGAIIAILVASGWAMERLVARGAGEPFSGSGG